jgi:hypothetical protein
MNLKNMRECDNSKIHIKQQLPIVYMSSNNVGHLITSTITTLQHFATLNHTSPNYTSLHFSTLHFLSFTLHYSPIWSLLSHLATSLTNMKIVYAKQTKQLHHFKNNLMFYNIIVILISFVLLLV